MWIKKYYYDRDQKNIADMEEWIKKLQHLVIEILKDEYKNYLSNPRNAPTHHDFCVYIIYKKEKEAEAIDIAEKCKLGSELLEKQKKDVGK